MPLVFISYNRKDGKYAKALQKALVTNGVEVFRDVDSNVPGVHFPKALGEAIDKCDVFVLLWTHHSSASHFVTEEWNIAVARRRLICPVLLDEDLPLPAMLSPLHALQKTNPAKLALQICDLFEGYSPPVPPGGDRNYKKVIIGTLSIAASIATILVLTFEFFQIGRAPQPENKDKLGLSSPSKMQEQACDSITNAESAANSDRKTGKEKGEKNEDPETENSDSWETPSGDSLKPLIYTGFVYGLDGTGTKGLPGAHIIATKDGEIIQTANPILTQADGSFIMELPSGSLKPDKIVVCDSVRGFKHVEIPPKSTRTHFAIRLMESL